jgi:hypothetical protein
MTIKKYFILSSIFFLLPSIFFLNPNNLKQVFYTEILIIFIIPSLLLISLFLIDKFLYFLFKRDFFYLIIFYSSLFYFSSFFYSFVPKYIFYFQILILVIFFFFIRKYSEFFYRTIITFFIINLFYFLINAYKSEQLNVISYDNSYLNYKNEDKIDNNIYYIILDGMNSFERMTDSNIGLSKHFENFQINLKENDYIYLENSISSYNTTYLSLASIFYNNYPVDENSIKYLNRDLFFPNFFIKNHNNISLVNFLKNNNYNFSWIGNNFRPDSLAPQHSLIKNKDFIFEYFYQNISLIFLFFENSYIDGVIRKIIKLKNKDVKNIDNNDAILKLTNFINSKNFHQSSKNYFFVHHIYPHTPFVLNKDCTYKKQVDKNFKTGYLDNYLCTLNKINDFVNLLSKKDPNSIVVLQADHGWELNKKNSQDTRFFFSKDRIEIFNAIKLPEKYKRFATEKLDNVNTSRLINSIILDVEPKLLEKKTFFGYYEFQNSKNYGKVKLYEN